LNVRQPLWVMQKDNMMRKIFAVAMIASGLLVSACNTVEGAGKDVSSAGNAVADAAKDSK